MSATTDSQTLGQLADNSERLMQLFIRARAQLLDRARQDVDWADQLLISTLVRQGPMRAKDLAEQLQSDPSTVSRQVAQLVREGFLERLADAHDGRASLLRPTAKARRVVADRKQVRNAHFRRMLRHWDPADRERFAALLGRFVEDFEAYRQQLADNGWQLDRPAEQDGTSGRATGHSGQPA
jgi:DNA-binding MarR family transcriptional regulator